MTASAPKPLLLLVPGLLCDAAVWPVQVAALDHAVDCLVIDHGDADSITAMAERAIARVPDGRAFSVAGHSMGGRVALEIARLAPERLERIALLDTGYQAQPAGAAGEAEQAQRLALLAKARAEGMRAMGEQWAVGMVHPDRRGDAVFGDVLDMIGRSTPERFAAQIRALLGRPDATQVLQSLRVPTLLLCGREDLWSPLARHAEMQALVPGARLEVVEHSGHMTTMERPEPVARALADWLGVAGKP